MLIYGLVRPLANLVCLYYVDTWGRKKTLWITGVAMKVDMAIIMGLSGGFVGSSNMVAKGFNIAFIFLFSMMQAYPSQARSSISVVCNVLINIVFNQVSPIAFSNVGYKYYALFICTNIVGAITVFLYLPETKGKTLEEIGHIFGGDVVVADLQQARQKIEANDVEMIEQVEEQR
ncbi:hypothetical protein BJX63DRAFT_436586 [Aspergillus granulosus]|uniref:Major facilitator superfamily (MFS) profile domain-containing protein n=1 Tax=Aspergillus granulosus TaxID=176169 RepID=A0ABR4GXQ7_9EURO